MIINAYESNGDVVFDYTGTLDITSLGTDGSTTNFNSTVSADFVGEGFFFSIGSAGAGVIGGTADIFLSSNPFATFGPGGTFGNDTIGTGDIFGFSAPGRIYAPSGFAGGSLSGSTTFVGESFSTLGMTQGTYVNTLPNDTITLNVGTAAAPAPLPILGLPAVFFYSRKLKKRIKASREASSKALV